MKRCPQCGASVDDLAIFCDKCDAILDTEALLEDERPSPPKKIPQKNVPPKVEPQRRASAPPPKRPEPPPFVPRSSQSEVRVENSAELQLKESFDEMLSSFRNMGIAQRAGVVFSLLSFIFSFFPWVSIPQEGSVPGLDVGGFYLIMISIVYFTYIVLDYTNNQYISRFEQYRVLILISLGFLGVLLCTYRIIFPYQIEEGTAILKNIGLKLDIHRKIGLFLASLSSVGMFISPLLGGFVKRK